MPSPGTISVVVPVHRPGGRLERIRDDLEGRPGVELVIVLNGEAALSEISPRPGEVVVRSARRGRGFAMVEGAGHARGDVVLFLHSDTVLPDGWAQEVRDILSDARAVGGAFSLSFDDAPPTLKVLIPLSDAWGLITGQLWGDRALFVRSEVLKECISSMDVPIFEDVQLSREMNARGKVLVSRKKVITSGEAFRRNGVVRQASLILLCHFWYLIGWGPERIFEKYYR